MSYFGIGLRAGSSVKRNLYIWKGRKQPKPLRYQVSEYNNVYVPASAC